MEYFVLFLALGLGLIYLHRHPNFLTNFWIPQQYIQTVGRIALMVGIISIAVSLEFYFTNMRSPFMLSLVFLLALIVIVVVIGHSTRGWASSANADQRSSHRWSLKNWIPALIVLLIIMWILSNC
ncbi:MAG: hypothetical protein KAU24_01555 [Candidatus Aenigmarchaeota archaeon]|nr:hypothetical protein [Candidatus Aenigmarchaeota archaeon]